MSKYQVGYSWERKGIESTIVAVVRNSEDNEFVECLVEERRPNEENDGMETFYVHQKFYDALVYDVIMVEFRAGRWIYKFNQEPLSLALANDLLNEVARNKMYDSSMSIQIIENKGGN